MSWGTKGSDKAEALPSISSSKTKDADSPVVEDTHRIQEDVDAAFKETVTRAVTKIDVKEVIEKPTMDDQNKTFRTRLVAFWMLTNAGLAVAIENINGLTSVQDAALDQAELQTKQNTYFAVILYSTFVLAAVRFTGVSYSRGILPHRHSRIASVLVLLVQTQSFQMLQEELNRRSGSLGFELGNQNLFCAWT